MCDCCCAEDVVADVCPNFQCSYRMCGKCRAREHDRQQNTRDDFRCPACRVYVAVKKHVSMPKYVVPEEAGPEPPTVVVFFPRCFCLRQLVRRVATRRNCQHAMDATLGILFPMGLCSFTLVCTILVGRLVFCLFHDQPLFYDCFVEDTMCALHLVSTGIIGAIYAMGITCGGCCVHACFSRQQRDV